ncbi:MAG TPA: hypothetical protein DHW82_14015 [Spirochaetia bacterium]|nr:MAG: hypothetical protein A2Y41_11970 [Spirochaetes bacterium GWB1_36_13]HCL58105.1 hypothetical protein [Spirochaetia bacterium]
MKKLRLLILSLAILTIGIMYAQQDGGTTTTTTTETTPKDKIDYGGVKDEASDANKGTQEQSLYKVTIDTFERSGEWRASMPLEYGLVNVKELPGAPYELAQMNSEKVKTPPKYGMSGAKNKTYFEEEMDNHAQIMGVRIDYMQRGYGWARIQPPFPIKLEGLVKGFEMWVCGRNKRHKLYVVLKDYYGEEKLLEVGQLNFMGWKKMSIQIPYTIVQQDFRFSTSRGITFDGFVINFNPEETTGKLYIYFDNLSVELSRFLEENRDQDDPLDVW